MYVRISILLSLAALLLTDVRIALSPSPPESGAP